MPLRKAMEREDCILKRNGCDDSKVWVRAEQSVINSLDNGVYQNEISELRFVELFMWWVIYE